MTQQAPSALRLSRGRQRHLRGGLTDETLLQELVRLRAAGDALAVLQALRLHVGVGGGGIVVVLFPARFETRDFDDHSLALWFDTVDGTSVYNARCLQLPSCTKSK